MNVFTLIRKYFAYCGIEKDEYNALKKEAYISNFKVWRVLHFLMAGVFGLLLAVSLFSTLMRTNTVFYLAAFVYSLAAISFFFALREDSLLAQFLIYLSISMLFLFGCVITGNKPDIPAVSFIVFLLITPMFMIDKPYFMAIELCAASAIFLAWMHGVKPYDVWRIDFINVIVFTVAGVFLNIIANAIRIREFVLTREINIQKDQDDLTGLRNKGALTREINRFLAEGTTGKGTLFMLDIDRFKSINDTYGHDVGDSVIRQVGEFLMGHFTNGEVTGRFGGDEFIVFIEGVNDAAEACRIAGEMAEGAAEHVALPDPDRKVRLSVGIALYSGEERNYSEIFKKADIALYAAKADPENRFRVYEPA